MVMMLQLHWHGRKYFLRGPAGNDIHKTNVPKLRIAFRHEVSLSFCDNLRTKNGNFFRYIFSEQSRRVFFLLSKTWKDEMQYVYSGKAAFPQEVDL